MEPPVGRRTAIVATVGVSSERRSCVEGLVMAGADVIRLSMVNGTRERHRDTARYVREIAAESGRRVRLLADLQGRKNRVGALPGGRADWATGETVVLTARPDAATSHRTWVTHAWKPGTVPVGSGVLIDDGAVILAVEEADADVLRCSVVEGGPVTDGRGVTMRGGGHRPGLTERDADDLRFAVSLGVDMVALSFARPDDHRALRDLAPDRMLIGKVEHPSAVDRLSDMAAVYDGLMVARGDLALELPFEEVPAVQKRTIAACARTGTHSMVATQLLHSMRESSRPTRAEVSDVANAVLDGADSLMLAGETGFGRHPVRAVDTLRRVIESAERYAEERRADPSPHERADRSPVPATHTPER
ncbi:pyruvate kinase [Streptomyces formicae]